jgi:hypothetical protein
VTGWEVGDWENGKGFTGVEWSVLVLMIMGFKKFHIGIRLLECQFLKPLYDVGNGPKSIPRIKCCEKVVGEEVQYGLYVFFCTCNCFPTLDPTLLFGES